MTNLCVKILIDSNFTNIRSKLLQYIQPKASPGTVAILGHELLPLPFKLVI